MFAPQRFVPLGFQQLTGASLLTPTVPAGATGALITVTGTAGARMRDDGTAPTALTGVVIPPGVLPFAYTGNLSALQFFPIGGTPLIDILYYRASG